MNITKNEIEIFDKLMDQFGRVLGNAGCNDFELKNNHENFTLVQDMERWADPKDSNDDPPDFSHPTIYTYDWMLLDYLWDKIKRKLETS